MILLKKSHNQSLHQKLIQYSLEFSNQNIISLSDMQIIGPFVFQYFNLSNQIIKILLISNIMGAQQSHTIDTCSRFDTKVTQFNFWGLSMAQIVIGSILIICLSIGGLYVYRRYYRNKIEQAQSNQPFTDQQLNPENKGPRKPQWKPLNMSHQQFKNMSNFIHEFTYQKYVQRVKELICPFSMQVMRQPCTMKCCQQKKGENRWAEKSYLEHQVKTRKKCLICQSPAKLDSISFDDRKQDLIHGFRQRILVLYKSLKQNQKKKWKSLIDNEFGDGYTYKNIQNYQLEFKI